MSEEKKEQNEWEKHWNSDKTHDRLEYINTSYPEVVKLLLEKTDKNSKCIELGCGSGTYAIELNNNDRACIASDYSKNAVKLAKMKARKMYNINIPTKVVDAYSIPYENDYFDLIFSDGVIEHLDIPKVMKEMYRATKPDGWMIAKVPSRSWLYKITYYLLSPVENRPFEAWYKPRKWAEFTRNAGFKNVKVIKCGGILRGFINRIPPLRKFINLIPNIGRIYYLIEAKK